MSNTATLQFTTVYDGQFFQISAEVIGGTCPRDVFIYRNHQEESQLTDFMGVASVSTLSTSPRWVAGPSQPMFGVPYLKWTVARKAFEMTEQCDVWKTLIRKDIRVLLNELDSQVPVVEIVDV